MKIMKYVISINLKKIKLNLIIFLQLFSSLYTLNVFYLNFFVYGCFKLVDILKLLILKNA